MIQLTIIYFFFAWERIIGSVRGVQHKLQRICRRHVFLKQNFAFETLVSIPLALASPSQAYPPCSQCGPRNSLGHFTVGEVTNRSVETFNPQKLPPVCMYTLNDERRFSFSPSGIGSASLSVNRVYAFARIYFFTNRELLTLIQTGRGPNTLGRVKAHFCDYYSFRFSISRCFSFTKICETHLSGSLRWDMTIWEVSSGMSFRRTGALCVFRVRK